jgi:hypothetical protein
MSLFFSLPDDARIVRRVFYLVSGRAHRLFPRDQA